MKKTYLFIFCLVLIALITSTTAETRLSDDRATAEVKDSNNSFLRCTASYHCGEGSVCINQQCRNPCGEEPSLCGYNAICKVEAHIPICSCLENFAGNPFLLCSPIADPPGELNLP